MLSKAINHMTTAQLSYSQLLGLANVIGCVGVEVRNDLAGELFDGDDAASAGTAASSNGLRLLALSEVSAFNDMSDRAFHAAEKLAALAASCGAEAINLIPRNDGKATSPEERKECLKETIIKFEPLLRKNNVLGFIEPLGFEESSLRSKSELVELLVSLEMTSQYRLVHDTFHHHLAGEKSVFPEYTGMVHISGVVNHLLDTESMRDEHRVLVDSNDVLGNLEQLDELCSKGYRGPISVEAFSTQVHALEDPETALSESFKYIETTMTITQPDQEEAARSIN